MALLYRRTQRKPLRQHCLMLFSKPSSSNPENPHTTIAVVAQTKESVLLGRCVEFFIRVFLGEFMKTKI
jgi:hypothetical protein